jgi:hypothetical protein
MYIHTNSMEIELERNVQGTQTRAAPSAVAAAAPLDVDDGDAAPAAGVEGTTLVGDTWLFFVSRARERRTCRTTTKPMMSATALATPTDTPTTTADVPPPDDGALESSNPRSKAARVGGSWLNTT